MTASFDWPVIYNRALAAALIPPGKTNAAVELSSGRRRTTRGDLDVKFSSEHFPLPTHEFTEFVAADHFAVKGLSVRNRQPGLGAPLIAVAPPSDRIPFSRSMPATVVLRVEGTLADFQKGGCTGLLDLYSGYDDESFRVDTRVVPLEIDSSAPLAYSLNQTSLWKVGERQFLTGIEQIPSGIYETRPYETGKIPVVFVHGTFSSPVWWVEMLNTLNADPVLRNRCQFWWFIYNSSSPMVFSALRLREALTNKLQQLDPQGADHALRDMIVIGHSQGGLLTRLAATDTGDGLWSAISSKPLEALQLSAEQEKLVHEYTVFTPLPFIKRVVFICTPHRGSYRVGNLVRNLTRRIITLPDKLIHSQERLLDVAARLDADKKLDRRFRTSLDSMSPSNPALLALANIPLAPGIKGHSIVAVKGDGDYTQGADGMVSYSSAHLDGMQSEYIVRASHSCLSEPATIEEVRRILRVHLAESPSLP